MLAAAASPWALLGYPVALALLGMALHLAWLVPDFVGQQPKGRSDLTVLSLNMRLGKAEAASLAQLVRRQRPAVVVLNEITPAADVALGTTGVAGPGTELPYRAGAPASGGGGTVVLSRFGLRESRALPIGSGAFRMRVQAAWPFWLTAVHTARPMNSP